ncbi:MAG TPA: hypothetical protein VGC97_03915 [Pyrinomonadaceae bacterium]|jgi:hypothetical protein
MKKLILLFFVLGFVLTLANSNVFAQRETSTGISVDKDIELLRRDLRSEKKKIIAMNVPLTDTEATKFWVVYDQYAGEMTKNYDEFYSLIKEYAANQKTLNDTQAISMIKQWNDIQIKLAQTRQKYIPLVEKVIPGKKAALFFQIDRRLYALMDIQIASEVPLVIQ